MRAIVLVALCVILTGCMKSADIAPLPPVTRITLGSSELAENSFSPENGHLTVNVPRLRAFIDGHSQGWTRAIAVGFGPPSPAWYAHLYDGDRYLGYFAVGGGALHGSAAFFRVRYGEFFAQKRVTAAEANRFLDLVGVGGGLAENMNNKVRQQVAKQPAASRARGLVEAQAKFQPGDRVRLKTTGAEGTVCLRTKFFREDSYFVTFPGSYYVFETVADRTQRDKWKAESAARSREWARSHGMAESAFDFPEYQPRPWHEEGPFYESDLELVSNGPN
jgi:hypothetical protein